MQKKTILAQVRALKRTERHLAWLRRNLANTRVHRRAELELLRRRTELALAAGESVESVIASLATAPRPRARGKDHLQVQL